MIPDFIPNWIDGRQATAASKEQFAKYNPHNGQIISSVARSNASDILDAVHAARQAYPGWAAVPPVKRGLVLHQVTLGLMRERERIARIVALETGKSLKMALAETDGAAELGLFYASEGQRLYGRTTTSGTMNRLAMTIRQPHGVAGLIIAANTPIANVAWKVFPALICGNAAVLKCAEDTPATGWIFGEIAASAGLPPGVLNIVQGYGEEAGAPLVAHPDVSVLSFTGSTMVGKLIAQTAANRLAKVSLELGGKNPFLVCDDADLERAAKWVLLSAFSNAGQRCASGSRILIFDSIYDRFVELLKKRTAELRVGPGDDDDFGPVINAEQLENILRAVTHARSRGARVLTGGLRLEDDVHRGGYYLAPTLIDNVTPDDEISTTELFGPVACLYRVRDFAEGLAIANASPFGLTACVHTRDLNRALEFTLGVEAGVVVVNAGTYGSEPHMPFGGVKQSGNGSREPGTEALDIYSTLKDVYLNIDPAAV